MIWETVLIVVGVMILACAMARGIYRAGRLAEHGRVYRFVLNEYRYWSASSEGDDAVADDVTTGMHMGAMAAAANLMAAMQGHPSPWHAEGLTAEAREKLGALNGLRAAIENEGPDGIPRPEELEI